MSRLAKLVSILIVSAGWASASVAAPTVLHTVCGSTISTATRTATGTFETPSEIPVLVPGGQFVVTVPAGTQRCIKLRFSAGAYCPHGCFLRVLDSNGLFQPSANTSPILRFANNNEVEAHSFEWVQRVGPGRHIVKLQIQTGNTIANAVFGPYTIVLEVTN